MKHVTEISYSEHHHEREKRLEQQPKADHTAQKAKKYRDENEANKVKIKTMNGLENHPFLMQSTLTRGKLKDKFEHGKYERRTRMHNKGAL